MCKCMHVCFGGVFSKQGSLPQTPGRPGLKVRFKPSPCFTMQSVQCCVMKWFSKGACEILLIRSKAFQLSTWINQEAFSCKQNTQNKNGSCLWKKKSKMLSKGKLGTFFFLKRKQHNLYHFLKVPTLTTNRLGNKSKGGLRFLITTTQP